MTETHTLFGRPSQTMLLMAMAALSFTAAPKTSLAVEVPILLYHRFDSHETDSTTITTKRFEEQLAAIEQNGYRVIPLRQFVDHLVSHGSPPPPGSVAITVDDSHRSVYTQILPLVLRHHIPVTLFVYPSAISNAPYAMTWQQLRELRATGLFDIQSHTYWHPNFVREKQRLTPAAYRSFVDMQLLKSKQVLEERLGGKVDLLAWPFGLHDGELEQRASEAGYRAAFTIEPRAARRNDDPMALPRYFITKAVSSRAFAAILQQSGDSK